jgi:hypothetical protein
MVSNSAAPPQANVPARVLQQRSPNWLFLVPDLPGKAVRVVTNQHEGVERSKTTTLECYSQGVSKKPGSARSCDSHIVRAERSAPSQSFGRHRAQYVVYVVRLFRIADGLS